ncbi:MAG: esterase-like activity of phytase family protein, partial [Pseudomonadota bacterium]
MDVSTIPVDLNASNPDQTSVGDLTYLGGLEIAEGANRIGGISGLEWADGQLVALTDDGRWLKLTLTEESDRLIGIASGETGRLLNENGKALEGKLEADSESLARSRDGNWLVGFERNHRILIYSDLAAIAGADDFAIVSLVDNVEPNKGLEALAVTDRGLIACGEWAGSETPNCMREEDDALIAFELTAPFPLNERRGFPTDIDCASNGDCYVLFRSYTKAYGNSAAIISINGDFQVGTIATFLPPLALDNFEGLTVREDGDRTFLYIASDNNFSPNQRTLLMKFEIGADRPSLPAQSSAEEAAKDSPIIVTGKIDESDELAVRLGSRIKKKPRFTNLTVA